MNRRDLLKKGFLKKKAGVATASLRNDKLRRARLSGTSAERKIYYRSVSCCFAVVKAATEIEGFIGLKPLSRYRGFLDAADREKASRKWLMPVALPSGNPPRKSSPKS